MYILFFVSCALCQSWASTDFWPRSASGLTNAGLPIVDGVTVQMAFSEAMRNGLVDVVSCTVVMLECVTTTAPTPYIFGVTFSDWTANIVSKYKK